MCVTSNFRVLVVGGRRVLLKLCFPVFIVLSTADEVGTCRVYEGAWGGVALWVSRVRVYGRRLRPKLTYRVTRIRSLLRSSYAPSVVAGPGSVDSAYGFPNGRRHLLSRLPQAFLGPLNHTSGQLGSISDHASLVRGSLR
jgi:hypothetical protein